MPMLCLFSGLDSSGVLGQILHYALIFAIMGGTVLFFIYLWRQDRLDMNEKPKYQMLEKTEEKDIDGK